MPISHHQLATALLAADHVAERQAIAAFVADAATGSAPNPFAQTSAGAVHHVWRQRAAEFRALEVEVIGLACLLTTVSGMGGDEVLVQEIVRARPHTANVFHRGDGCRIVGAVLYGKPGVALPAAPAARHARPAPGRRSRIRTMAEQLDLFMPAGALRSSATPSTVPDGGRRPPASCEGLTPVPIRCERPLVPAIDWYALWAAIFRRRALGGLFQGLYRL